MGPKKLEFILYIFARFWPLHETLVKGLADSREPVPQAMSQGGKIA